MLALFSGGFGKYALIAAGVAAISGFAYVAVRAHDQGVIAKVTLAQERLMVAEREAEVRRMIAGLEQARTTAEARATAAEQLKGKLNVASGSSTVCARTAGARALVDGMRNASGDAGKARTAASQRVDVPANAGAARR